MDLVFNKYSTFDYFWHQGRKYFKESPSPLTFERYFLD